MPVYQTMPAGISRIKRDSFLPNQQADMTGTLINVFTVIAGSFAGILLNSKLPERIVRTVFQAIGLFTLALGAIMAIKAEHILIIVFGLIIGAVAGELLNLEKHSEHFADKLKKKLNLGNPKFTEGMLTAFLLFCMGSMTIIGAFEEGFLGKPDLLITKSLMDGFAAMALASAYGAGVAFSVIPLFLFQGGLTLASAYLGDFLDESVIKDITATGGILLIGLGFSITDIKKLKILNILPAVFVVGFLAWLNSVFNLI